MTFSSILSSQIQPTLITTHPPSRYGLNNVSSIHFILTDEYSIVIAGHVLWPIIIVTGNHHAFKVLLVQLVLSLIIDSHPLMTGTRVLFNLPRPSDNDLYDQTTPTRPYGALGVLPAQPPGGYLTLRVVVGAIQAAVEVVEAVVEVVREAVPVLEVMEQLVEEGGIVNRSRFLRRC